MTETARWTIEELATRYEFEPTLKDIFVEGRFDQEVLSNLLRSQKIRDRKVYEIDNVEVPNHLVIANGLTEGNKQRVITLARELSKQSEVFALQCLVDKDLDHWFCPLEINTYLTWTEYCSIELYYFSDEILRDLLLTTAKAKIGNWEQYKASLITTLRDLYALRLADCDLDWHMEWIDFEKDLSGQDSQIIFDLPSYVARLLSKNRKLKSKSQFSAALTQWQDRLTGDCRNFIRGHDFVELIAWSVKGFKGVKEFSSSDVMQRLFILLASNNKVPNLANAIK